MKIDKVLEAHGIGIVQLTPPVIPSVGVITNGLVGYWNSKQGVNGTTWNNLAPATSGQYASTIYGATVTTDGMRFNGTTSYASIPIPAEMRVVTSATFEMRFRLESGSVDMINQSDGRELIWLDYAALVLSGVFDANKYQDQKRITATTQNVTYYLTITADLTTNRITAYLYNPTTGTTITDFYQTTIGTIADGQVVILSGTNYKFVGIIDNIRIYNRVLTAEEIAQNRAVGANL